MVDDPPVANSNTTPLDHTLTPNIDGNVWSLKHAKDRRRRERRTPRTVDVAMLWGAAAAGDVVAWRLLPAIF